MSFGYKSTSDDIMKEYGPIARDKYVIVTGGNTGLGEESAKALSAYGAHVLIACRTKEKGLQAVARIQEKYPNASLSVESLDLADLGSVKSFAKSYIDSGKPLNILLNNAGVMALPKSFTKDGFEMQMGTNHFGHFLLTSLLLPVLKKSGTKEAPSRVVNLSSIANYCFAPTNGVDMTDFKAEKGYNPWYKYGESKLANILYSNELNRRMKEENANVISVAVHPGVILETELTRHSSTSSNFAILWALLGRPWALYAITAEGTKTIPQGTATSLYCALSPQVVPGEYYSDSQIDVKRRHPHVNDPEVAKKFWSVTTEALKDHL